MFITDTHPLIWLVAGNRKRLGRKVCALFDDVLAGRQAVYVPSTVFWEISLAEKSGGLEFDVSFAEFVDRIMAVPTFIEDPVTHEIVKRSHELNFHSDPFDQLIVASALEKRLPLITDDSVLHKHRPCELYWD